MAILDRGFCQQQVEAILVFLIQGGDRLNARPEGQIRRNQRETDGSAMVGQHRKVGEVGGEGREVELGKAGGP